MTIEQYAGKIMQIVADQYSVSIEDIISTSRLQEVVDARDTTIYLLHKYLSLSTIKIGKIVHRDCGLVSYSLKKVNDRLEGSTDKLGLNKVFKAQVNFCERALKTIIEF